MNKKARKIDETKAADPTQKAATEAAQNTTVRYAHPADVKKSMNKVFRVHRELLRKLAQ